MSDQITDYVKLRGSLRIHLCDPSGNILEKQLVENTIVTVGRSWMLGQMQSVNHVTSQNVSHMAIGSGTVAPTTGDSTLGNEVTRQAIDSFATTGLTVNPPSWRAQATFATSVGNTTLGEVALFNSSSVGTMLGRATFASMVKATSNTLAISYSVSMG